MKKNAELIFALAVLLANFLAFWYSDVLLDRFFVFGIIPQIISLIALIVCFVRSLNRILRHLKTRQYYLSLLICVLTVLLIIYFPFRTAKVNLEMRLFERQRLQVVAMVKNGEIVSDKLGNVELPWKYQHTSSDGEIYIYQNDEEQVICFWVFRGMLSGSVQLMYSSQDESLIYENESAHKIEDVVQLKEHWYLVNTDY